MVRMGLRLLSPAPSLPPYLRKRNSRFRLRQQSRIYPVCRSTPSISMMRLHQPMPRKPLLCHPLVSSTDEQDVEATQAFDTSGGITDLEELAAEDPEHDPLKTIPVAPKEPSADKRKIIAIVAAIAAVAVAIAGVIVVRNRINSKEQRAAVVVCEKAKSKYSKANEKLQNAIEQATSLQGTAAKPGGGCRHNRPAHSGRDQGAKPQDGRRMLGVAVRNHTACARP